MSLIDPFVPELGKHTLSTRLRLLARNAADMPATLGEMVSTRRDILAVDVERGGEMDRASGDRPAQSVAVRRPRRRRAHRAGDVRGSTGVVGAAVHAWHDGADLPDPLAGSIRALSGPCRAAGGDRAVPGSKGDDDRPSPAGAQTEAGTPSRWMPDPSRGGGRSGAARRRGLGGSFGADSCPAGFHDMRGTANYTSSDGATRQYVLYYYGPEWQSFEHALTWLKANARSDDIVITSAPYWTWLWTGLKAAQPAYEADSAEEQRQLETVGATYLVLDAFVRSSPDVSRRYADPAVRAHPEAWELAYTTPEPPGANLSPSPLNFERPALNQDVMHPRGLTSPAASPSRKRSARSASGPDTSPRPSSCRGSGAWWRCRCPG